jgi:hypothetical protein
VLRLIRSVGGAVTALIAVVAIELASSISSAAPASATTPSAMMDAYTPPLTVLITPLTVGVHLIEALAQGIANAVEYIATPAPIAIPAPHNNT